MKVAMVSRRTDALQDFVRGLGGDVEWFAGTEEFLDQAPETSWNLVVVDAALPGMDIRAFLQTLLDANSLLHTAVISDLGPGFLDQSAGLGVLCAVPADPTWEDGAEVMNRLCLFYDMG
jgi:hypothetical protein